MSGMRPGPRNLITDVDGLRVGNAGDARLKSGSTVLLADAPVTAGVHVMGGAPGTRETDLLAPDKLVQQVDAITLSGGSAFGLDAAGGVVDGLRAMGRGFRVMDAIVPIVPGAILFDLANGGAKDWDENPYRALGRAALENACIDFQIGTAGAGVGATTATLKGGLGSASLQVEGYTVGALVAVNAFGSVLAHEGPHFLAAACEFGAEFGGRGISTRVDPAWMPPAKSPPGTATTIAIVATDAALSQAQATRMAVAAHDGMARAISPSHTPLDGDLVFGVSTGAKPAADPGLQALLGHAAALCLSRAIARGVYEATPAPGDLLPTWRERFS